MKLLLTLAGVPALLLAACSSPTQDTSNDAGMVNAAEATGLPANDAAAMPAEPVLPPSAAATNEIAAADDPFVGRWTGPEGLYADIAAGPTAGAYTVEMQYTLDDKGSFPATRQGDALVVTRGGETVRITQGDGDATGMKWLAGKSDCLVVKPGSEGYCRD